MNKEEIIEMAREAGFDPHDMSSDFTCNLENINAFAKLVAEKAIEEALAQPEQEPCKTCNGVGEVETGIGMMVCDDCHGITYTNPPQRTWIGLTDEEILAVNMSTVTKLIDEPIVCDTDHNIIQLGKAIEAKLKEKNT